MDLTVRPITRAEVGAFRAKLVRGFGGDLAEEDADPGRFLAVVDLDRTVSAFDGDELIGTGAAFTFDLTVPGGALPMGGTTMVTVQPTHRRRGVLRAMMRAHLDEIRGRGEPLAGLWASESSIYGRFGYGRAVESCKVAIDARHVRFRGEPPPGRVALVDPSPARAPLAAVYDRARPRRPGMFTRTEAWWDTRLLHDAPHRRQGRSAQRYAVYEGPSGPEGYVIYRQRAEQTDFHEGQVHVFEMVFATPEANEAMWRYCAGIDLFPHVQYWNAPLDDALPWLLTEPRRAQRRIADTMWLRILDVPRALAGRAYGVEGRLVLGVRDPFLPDTDGRYELEATAAGAACRRTDAAADVELDVASLGAVYLGGHRPTTLARAGLVAGAPEALALADRLFAWDPLPWCPEDF